MSLQLEWTDLRQCALEQLRCLGPCSIDCPQADLLKWDDMVLRFRKLRESLAATHADAVLCCEVYELSAVVCAAARNMAELLKCLQQLVNNHHPTVLKQQQQQQQQQHRRSATPDGIAAAAHCDLQQRQQQESRTAAVDHAATAFSNVHQQRQLQQQDSQPAAAVDEAATALLDLPPQQQQHHHHRYSQSAAAVDEAAAALHDLDLQQEDSSNNSRRSSWELFLDQDVQQRAVEVAAALLLYFACVPCFPIKQELIKQIRQASITVLQVNVVDQGSESIPQQQGSCSTQPKVELAVQQQQQQLLLLHPTYQLAVRAAAAVLNCNWIQFWRCYNSFSSRNNRCRSGSGSGFLIRSVMEIHIQRLRVQVVTTAATAYRMVSAEVLLRWLYLSAAAAAGSSGVGECDILCSSNAQFGNCIKLQSSKETSSSNSMCDSQETLLVSDNLVQVLSAAAEAGSKGCRVAVDQCSTMDQAALPETIMFRS